MVQYKQETKRVIIYIMLVILSTVLSALLSRKYYGELGVQGCALDGIFIWAVKPRLEAYVLLPITAFWCLRVTTRDFCPQNVIYYRSRHSIWYRQMAYCLQMCGITMLIDMLVSFLCAAQATGRYSNYRLGESWFCSAMGAPYGTMGELGSLPVEVLKGYLLNVMEIYLVVVIAQLLFWITNNRIGAMLFVIAAGVSARFSCPLFFSKAGGTDSLYYHQIMNQRSYIVEMSRTLCMICAVWVLAFFVVRRKDFLFNERTR